MYPRRSLQLSIAAGIVAFLTFACARPASIAPAALPSYLRPLPGARDVVAKKQDPNEAVEYTLDACYPADSELKSISTRIPPTWHARREDFMNPGIPTSQVRGWTNYYDSHSGHHEWVNHWSGQWQDGTGALVSYDLMYRSPGVFKTPQHVPSNCKVQVIATLIPADVVRHLQR